MMGRPEIIDAKLIAKTDRIKWNNYANDEKICRYRAEG